MRPFIVTLASEKGGVGKTTIATNLAVYLKALREDLSVTIASFDNHFSVDQMFAIAGRSAGSVADLLEDRAIEHLVHLGEYGVQFIASERRLAAPDEPPEKLAGRLRGLPLDGILVLDTRPIMDWFTRAALLAADLVLVPVKDRASLVNASAIRTLLEKQAAGQRLWLVPSLVDARARLNADVKVKDFLIYAAGERDYQIVETFISKSPKVESLASGFSSRVFPVLTHARQTAVHGQLRKLAEFVLGRFDSHDNQPNETLQGGNAFSGGLRHLAVECPICSTLSIDGQGYFYFDLRSRRCGFLHPDCLPVMTGQLQDLLLGDAGGSLAIRVDGAGFVGDEPEIYCHLLDAEGAVLGSGQIGAGNGAVHAGLEGMTGRKSGEWQREAILLELQLQRVADFAGEQAWQDWRRRRRKLLQGFRWL